MFFPVIWTNRHMLIRKRFFKYPQYIIRNTTLTVLMYNLQGIAGTYKTRIGWLFWWLDKMNIEQSVDSGVACEPLAENSIIPTFLSLISCLFYGRSFIMVH